MLNNLFSIIIPAHNRESLVCEALDSVKAQTYRPIEIIVVDDGSTDSTKEVVQEWESLNAGDELSLRYFYQENAGAGVARNRGIQEISGEYVQFLDSDDRIHPERLTLLAETFKKEKCDFIQTGFEGFDADTGEIISTHYGRTSAPQLDLALRGVVWANTLRSAFTHELVLRTGPWNTEMPCFEDREYIERALLHSEKSVVITDILASARRGGAARVSDLQISYEGRKWRIFCEKRLADGCMNRSDVRLDSKQAFSSRLYALGFRTNGSGWLDLGKQCGEIANSMGVKLDTLGKRRKLVWRMGKLGGVMYELLSKLRKE